MRAIVKIVVGITCTALVLLAVWFPYINDFKWYIKPWVTIKGFELAGVRSGSATFGSMPAPRLEAQLVWIRGWPRPNIESLKHWGSKEPAIAVIPSGGGVDETLIGALEDLGFSGVIVLSGSNFDRRPISSGNEDVGNGIKIPSVRIGKVAAKSLSSQDYAEFIAVVSHELGIAIGIFGTFFTLIFSALAMAIAFDESEPKSARRADKEPASKSEPDASEPVSPKGASAQTTGSKF